mgnify:CR=1 FL=1|tara:strand:- start:681 stop:1169 length:489 start_codon:yes stop_codon:yes gene_type:complete
MKIGNYFKALFILIPSNLSDAFVREEVKYAHVCICFILATLISFYKSYLFLYAGLKEDFIFSQFIFGEALKTSIGVIAIIWIFISFRRQKIEKVALRLICFNASVFIKFILIAVCLNLILAFMSGFVERLGYDFMDTVTIIVSYLVLIWYWIDLKVWISRSL